MTEQPHVHTDPLMEIIAKKLSGIGGVDMVSVGLMTRAACKAAYEYHQEALKRQRQGCADAYRQYIAEQAGTDMCDVLEIDFPEITAILNAPPAEEE